MVSRARPQRQKGQKGREMRKPRWIPGFSHPCGRRRVSHSLKVVVLYETYLTPTEGTYKMTEFKRVRQDEDGRYEDAETGEQLDGTPILVPNKGPRTEPWIRAMQNEAFKQIFTDRELEPAALRVMGLLIQSARYGNEVHVKQADLAEELDYDKSTVSRAFRSLKEKGHITEGELDGVYYLSEKLFWKGDMRNREKLRKTKRKERRRELREKMRGSTPERDGREHLSIVED